MVKFSKELEAQLIPEWKDAFVNYWQLKKHVKDQLSRTTKQPPSSHDHEIFGRSIFRFMAMKVASCSSKNNTNEIIQVKSKSMDSDEDEVLYQTELIVADRQKRRKAVAGDLLQRSSSSFSSSRNSDSFSESAAELNDSSTEISKTDLVIAALERNDVNFMNSASCKAMMTKKGKPKMAMRIDIPATTPARTISAVTSMIWEDLVNHPKKEGHGDFINKKKIQCAEKIIRNAFVELYRGMACSKLIVSNQQVSVSYLKAVKRSHFISSDKVLRLMDEVESIFTKHFANNDRKKAMKFLRPQEQKNSYMVTFFVGLFTGSFVSLFSVYVILAHLSGIFSPRTETAYMETVYPVFSVFAFLSLHLFLYGCNLFMWKATRVNYNFIFEFSSSSALKYRDAFLICTTFMTSVVGAMVIHLLLRAGGFSPSHVDTIPGILFLVLMVDFFMADQLTSQIPLLRHLESTACYFLAGSFKTHEYATCKNGKIYRQLAYVISFLPYYWRAMQCARRWFDEYDLNHLANMGKYISAMVAAGARLTYATQSNNLWFSVVLITSVVATVYQLYWDFVKDWGLLDPNSRNPWLRDDLILKNKSIYYISIALNVVLRVAWIESIMRFRFNPVQTHLLDFFLASLEVFRRGHWNFYRLENEHLNNVGKFRAVKTVPLPFRETDSDG
ncbi:Phosphate transporter PHO1 [Hibiscus syriacus]|uniref:Phosphate transporter PHO1 n=1 Tax=Hibiscus syriacus TaxID=106335 RepID=A0A6A2X5S3_HIBSY|nr:Phosphate transporter PHO1 [Hibiscus syriacus]